MMPCLSCHSPARVTYTSTRADGLVARRYRCPSCKERFTTLETREVVRGSSYSLSPQPTTAVLRALRALDSIHALLTRHLPS